MDVGDVEIKRWIIRNSEYKVGETTDGHRIVFTSPGPVSAYANITLSQVVPHRIDQLEQGGALSGVEAGFLREAVDYFRNYNFDVMERGLDRNEENQ